MNMCSYGCGNVAIYQLKNGKYSCQRNYRMCPEIRKKSSLIRKGRKFSEEHKSNISKSLQGRKFSEEHKKSLSQNNRTFSLNENFFINMNSAEKWYWAGFILADGCISKSVLEITLKKSDHKHLMKFLKCIKSNYEIYNKKIKGKNDKIYEASRLVISNIVFINSLKKLGLTERKSFTAKPLDVPIKFEKDFWRGVFDGDGHIGFYNIKLKNGCRKGTLISLVGTKEICEGFKSFCSKYVDVSYRKVKLDKRSEKLYEFSLNGDKSIIISNNLYNNSKIYLDRKYEISKQFMKG